MDDLSKIFEDHKYHHFAIQSYDYSLDESNPVVTVRVSHYRQPEVVELIFSEVYFHSMMSESFIFMHDEDDWEISEFIAKAKNSQLLDWVGSYTLLGAEHIIKLSELNHYRIFGQDHFLDIVTENKPKLKLIK